MHLDAHALLTLLRFRLGDVFRSTLSFRERNYISGLLDTRNRWAHQLRFSADDTYRTLDDMERLLAAVSAPQSADVVHLKDRIKERWRQPPPPAPPPPSGEQVQPPKPGSAYRPLFDHLAGETADRVTCTFAQVERIIGRSLPSAARNHKRSAKRLPSPLCVPKLRRRQTTARHRARSAALFVGSTPSTATKAHRAGASLRMFWHARRVLACSSVVPSANSASTWACNGPISRTKVLRGSGRQQVKELEAELYENLEMTRLAGGLPDLAAYDPQNWAELEQGDRDAQDDLRE
jgi:Swt1-like HEPN